MPESCLDLVTQRFRDLLLGAPTGTVHYVDAGRFRETDKTYLFAEQPAGIFHQHPIEVEWDDSSQADETGPDYVSGDLVDSSATITVRVGYLWGVGKQIEVSARTAQDSRLIRRVLEHPGNYDEDNTGLIKVDWLRSRKSQPDKDGRVVMTLSFRVRIREEQPT